jgi:hypothetical protein
MSAAGAAAKRGGGRACGAQGGRAGGAVGRGGRAAARRIRGRARRRRRSEARARRLPVRLARLLPATAVHNAPGAAARRSRPVRPPAPQHAPRAPRVQAGATRRRMQARSLSRDSIITHAAFQTPLPSTRTFPRGFRGIRDHTGVFVEFVTVLKTLVFFRIEISIEHGDKTAVHAERSDVLSRCGFLHPKPVRANCLSSLQPYHHRSATSTFAQQGEGVPSSSPVQQRPLSLSSLPRSRFYSPVIAGFPLPRPAGPGCWGVDAASRCFDPAVAGSGLNWSFMLACNRRCGAVDRRCAPRCPGRNPLLRRAAAAVDSPAPPPAGAAAAPGPA